MSWDTNQVTHSATASGGKSRSSSSLPKGSLPLTSSPRPVTTPPPSSGNRRTAFTLPFFLAAFAALLCTGAFAQQQQPVSPSTAPVAPNAPQQSQPDDTYKIKSAVSLGVLHA